MAEFLTAAEFKALERVIAKARAEPGTHQHTISHGGAMAFRYINEIKWVVTHKGAKVAHGTVPLERGAPRSTKKAAHHE